MKNSSRSFLALSLIVVALVTSRCDCSQADTSSGRCEGFVGSQRFSGDIHSSSNSEYSVDYEQNLDLYSMRFGDGALQLQISGQVARADVLSGAVVLNLPGEVPTTGGGSDGGMGSSDGGTDGGTGGPGDGGTSAGSPEVKAWNVYAHNFPGERPKLRAGTLERSIDLVEQRLVGVLRLFFEDGSALTCDFALRHNRYADIGENPEGAGGCGGGSGGGGGGGGGGDSDFD